ncbi:hypothetical protein S7S_02745 [Isoalcanivorax pacificus W11-5]|uniref:Transmembrane protein n=1 Tax=Isoalcanivorax pacificus W11-5 TaxID=391936 RepID=A0A0B4XIW3_9GAMM|nr:hypothetical protein [Isoalcanivorax pacificus]AJD46971.1 hypothetical protein S7S_02745 [Isoalcanivorax pacificus W11-5]
MSWLKAFVAGFLATLLCHQAVVGLFYLAGMIPAPPFNLSPVPPLGVPQVISLAFWGGVWGLPLWWLIRSRRRLKYTLTALVAGAIAPTAVAMLVVFPLKGLAVNPQTVLGGLLVNGAWGLGVAVLMWLIHRQRPPVFQDKGGR